MEEDGEQRSWCTETSLRGKFLADPIKRHNMTKMVLYKSPASSCRYSGHAIVYRVSTYDYISHALALLNGLEGRYLETPVFGGSIGGTSNTSGVLYAVFSGCS